jgi:hypothetical protein
MTAGLAPAAAAAAGRCKPLGLALGLALALAPVLKLAVALAVPLRLEPGLGLLLGEAGALGLPLPVALPLGLGPTEALTLALAPRLRDAVGLAELLGVLLLLALELPVALGVGEGEAARLLLWAAELPGLLEGVLDAEKEGVAEEDMEAPATEGVAEAEAEAKAPATEGEGVTDAVPERGKACAGHALADQLPKPPPKRAGEQAPFRGTLERLKKAVEPPKGLPAPEQPKGAAGDWKESRLRARAVVLVSVAL